MACCSDQGWEGEEGRFLGYLAHCVKRPRVAFHSWQFPAQFPAQPIGRRGSGMSTPELFCFSVALIAEEGGGAAGVSNLESWRSEIVRTVPERMRLAQDAQHNINSTTLAVEDDHAKPMGADGNAGSFRIGRCRYQSEMAPRPRVRQPSSAGAHQCESQCDNDGYEWAPLIAGARDHCRCIWQSDSP